LVDVVERAPAVVGIGKFLWGDNTASYEKAFCEFIITIISGWSAFNDKKVSFIVSYLIRRT
jgi:hypothetical protein